MSCDMQDSKTVLSGQVLRCLHRKEFPPPRRGSLAEMNQAYQAGTITNTDLEKFKIWQKVCGLVEMDPKCLSCPFARVVRPNPMVPSEEELLPL